MLDADEVSTSSPPSVSSTESPSSPVPSMPSSSALRSLLPAQQRVQSLLVHNVLPPDTSSLIPLWRSSSALLASSLGESLRQSLPSCTLPLQQIGASFESAVASRLATEMQGAREVANAIAQIGAIIPPSIFQYERSLLQQIAPSTEGLEHLLSPVVFSQERLLQDVLSSHRLLLQQMNDFSHVLNSSLVTLIHWLPERVWQMGERLKRRLLAAFRRAKLCLAPSLSEEMMYQIMGYVEAGDLRPVTTLLWSYYARNRHARLHQAMASWLDHPEFAARRHIFEEAFASHRDGRYVASIRTLTPEIEGLGSYTVRAHNLRAVNKHGQDIGLHLGKPDSVMSRMVDAAEAADSGLLHWVRAHSTHAYLDVVLIKTDFEHEYDRVRDRRDVSRHGIAHGFQIQGYAWLNSLRLFLLLDTLHYLLWTTEQTTTGGVVV
jgi:hypothetical protein